MSAKPVVLIVDDDGELASMLAERLQAEGWSVQTVLTGGDGERAINELRPDAAVLDVMLPDANGLELCRRWRSTHPALGILMLTARGDPMDRVLGLEIGADDYLGKPFEPRELVARLRALLRRQAPDRIDAVPLRFNGLTIDLVRREARAEARVVELTGVEFRLLVALAQAPGAPQSRDALSAAVQPGNYKPQERTVDVQVARLRRKLREASPGTEWIDTVRGEGYVFVPRG
jgi:two-component system phosphate regulon response regulator OmpR